MAYGGVLGLMSTLAGWDYTKWQFWASIGIVVFLVELRVVLGKCDEFCPLCDGERDREPVTEGGSCGNLSTIERGRL